MKSLILAALITSGVGFSTPQNSNNGTYYQDVTITETYEYETNEINTYEDIIEGHIYKFNIDLLDTPSMDLLGDVFNITYLKYNIINIVTLNNNQIPTYVSIGIDLYEIDYLSISTNHSNNEYQIFIEGDNEEDNTALYIQTATIDENIVTSLKFNMYFIAGEGDNAIFETPIQEGWVHPSDYLGEKTITITPKEFNGFFTIIDNFLHERIFSGGILDTTQITILGQQMSMGQWLSSTTSIVLCCLIIIVLVLLLKYIFKYVGGMFIWKS